MPRFPRIVVPGYPHHVTQRGSRRQRTFFDESDYRFYIETLTTLKREIGVDIWAYCLMPNHVHLVVVPGSADSLARLFRSAHSRHAKLVNRKQNWAGHLWQERFYSVVLDDRHTIAAIRYVELNPVRAGLCAKPEYWPWSSVHSHLRKERDGLVDFPESVDEIQDWLRFLQEADTESLEDSVRKQTKSGRPDGNDKFIGDLELLTGRRIRPKKSGPKRTGSGDCHRN